MSSAGGQNAVNLGVRASQAPIINVTPSEIITEPFPYVIKQPLIQPDFYQHLKEEFPADALFEGRPQLFGSRTGRDFYKGDPEFKSFLAGSPAWRQFYEFINSPAFLQLTLELFGPHLKQFGCAVDPSQAKPVDYTEGRLSLWWRSKKAIWLGLGRGGNPNKLFTRFDIEQSAEGYAKPVHCDWPSRLVSMILYFCDADEIGMDGGDLRIHEPLERKPYSQYERHPREEQTRILTTIRPRENLGLLFLCSNNSYHSVTAVRSIRDYRRFIYLNVSSTAENIW